MLIEISTLPPTIQQQILSVQNGQSVDFANEGQVIGRFTRSKLIGDENVFGILKEYNIDGLEYERSLREEWVREWE